MPDETYLEAIIDHIQSCPAEVRRNLDLMGDLDQSGSALMEEMNRLQREYIQRVEEKIEKLEIIDGKGVRANAATEGDNNDAQTPADVSPVVIPTTEEFVRYVHDAGALARIKSIQAECTQRAEEKVAISEQTYNLVDNICRRLDSDILEMEKLLLTTGEFQAPGAANQGDLAAIQAPGSSDWILAKVMSYDPQTGMYRLSDEDLESNKIFNLPETQVIVLGEIRNLRAGDVVYAVYPDTTSFYKGTVSQAPRKAAGGGSLVMISFMDDHDENGITHDKAVQMKHVMLPPS